MLLNNQELAALKQKLEKREEPWWSAYQKVLAEADRALGQEPLSIIRVSNSRYFKQDSVYIPGKDGEKNPASNMRAGEMVQTISRCGLVLGAAYQLTGKKEYADKALQLVHAWCIDKATYMVPDGMVAEGVTPGLAPGGEVVMFLFFAPFFAACVQLNNYPGWDPAPKKAVGKWVRAMLEPNLDTMFHNGHQMYNNWEDARLRYLACGAVFLNDTQLLNMVFDRWQEIIPQKMTDEGQLPRETERTRSMSYTLSALSEALEVAEIARHYGRDLYNYTANGKSIKKALDYATGYLLNIGKWPFPMLKPIEEEFGEKGAILFELAYAHWRQPEYLAVLEKYGSRSGTGALAALLHAR
jgi:hypothetical protein